MVEAKKKKNKKKIRVIRTVAIRNAILEIVEDSVSTHPGQQALVTINGEREREFRDFRDLFLHQA